MRWRGQRQSSNVEDRRGLRVTRGGMVGGGLGLVAIMLIGMFLGLDPRLILGGAQIVESVAPPAVEDTGPYFEHRQRWELRQHRGIGRRAHRPGQSRTVREDLNAARIHRHPGARLRQ